MNKLKIVFAGSPEFVFPVLEVLAEEHELVAVMTNAPAPTGRGKKLCASPIAQCVRSAVQCADAPDAIAGLSTAELLEVETIDAAVFE